MYEETLGKDLGSLRNFLSADFYKKNQFGIRIYRRGNIGDTKDFDSDKISVEEMEQFIVKSTFVGQGPDIIRQLDTETAIEFFG